jgi:prepilin-type N-terminal cleavage/methylation domain-containing protein/prepilin-type processing-associated H-X9-DG protein
MYNVRRAFTLIELLVVIAIIAILAAILFPVFSQAKAAAKKTQCLSNQKQIGTGLYLYVQDSDDSLPMANYPGTYVGPPFTAFSWHAGAGKGELNWADLLQPYVKNYQLFKCPTDSTGKYSPGGVPVPGELLSYALNAYFYRQPNGVARFALTGGSMSEITTASSKIFIAETASNSTAELMRPDRWKAPDGSSTFERHLGGANYVYADTHARYHKMPQWWKDTTYVWNNPDIAQTNPAPQWFPWLDTSEEKW